MRCYHSNETSFAEPLHNATVKARFTDTRWRWTPHYYGQFSLSLRKKPDISSTFNPFKTDTPLIQTFSMVYSVSILKVFDCIYFGFLICVIILHWATVVLIIKIFTLDTKWLATSTGSSSSSSSSARKVLRKKRKVVKHYVCNLSIYYYQYYPSLMTLYNLDMNKLEIKRLVTTSFHWRCLMQRQFQ